MKRLKAIWLILFAKGYYVVTDKGTTFYLPLHKEMLEALMSELDDLKYQADDWLQEIELQDL